MNNKLQAAVEIAEEIEASLAPVITGTQNEADSDTYLMCRAAHRQAYNLSQRLRDMDKDYIMEGESELYEKLENTQKLSEKLHSLLQLWMEGNLTEADAYILSIATDINHNVLQEIARVRGVEYQ